MGRRSELALEKKAAQLYREGRSTPFGFGSPRCAKATILGAYTRRRAAESDARSESCTMARLIVRMEMSQWLSRHDFIQHGCPHYRGETRGGTVRKMPEQEGLVDLSYAAENESGLGKLDTG